MAGARSSPEGERPGRALGAATAAGARPARILVAVDIFDASRWAWHQAGELASVLNARREVVHVLRPGLGSGLAARRGKALRALAGHLGVDEKLHAHLVPGEPMDVILRLAADLEPELVVMGTHGRKGLERLVLGSTAEAVVRRSPAPVMTVRGMARPINSILVPVSKSHYAISGLAQAIGEAGRLGASLTLLHVAKGSVAGPNPGERLRSLLRRLPAALRKRCRLQVEVYGGDPVDAILSAADYHDLVALVQHRKGPLTDWALGTTAQRVLRRCEAPVLSLPYLAPEEPERARLLSDAFRGGRAS